MSSHINRGGVFVYPKYILYVFRENDYRGFFIRWLVATSLNVKVIVAVGINKAARGERKIMKLRIQIVSFYFCYSLGFRVVGLLQGNEVLNVFLRMDHTKHKCQYRFPVSVFLPSSVRVRKIAGFRKFTIFSIKWSQCFLQISKKLSDCKTLFYVKKCYSCSTLSPSGGAAGLMVALILKLTFNLPQSSKNQTCTQCLTIFGMKSTIYGKGTFSL